MKKCVKSTHIINKPNLNFMGEEEIVAAEKKYEAILDYCLSDPNTPKYPNKILNYETKMRNNKKKHFRDLVAKGKDLKQKFYREIVKKKEFFTETGNLIIMKKKKKVLNGWDIQENLKPEK